MKTIFTTGAALLASLLMTAGAAESERIFTYTPDNPSYGIFGTTTKDTYDVAILMKDQSLVGAKVMGFTVPISTTEYISNPTGWLTTTLKLEEAEDGSIKNVPDICSVEATLVDNGGDNMDGLTVTFSEPYTVTEAGVYVGFTFKVDKLEGELQEYPLVLAQGTAEYPATNAFFLHTRRVYTDWYDFGAMRGVIVPMQVTLSGEFLANAVTPIDIAQVSVMKGETAQVPVTITNDGSAPVESVKYTYTLGGESVTGSVTLDAPLPASFGSRTTLNVPMKAPATSGVYDIVFTVNEVNSEANEFADIEAEGRLTVVDFVPTYRPLMEEFTGLWCGNCPRGMVGMEMMKEKYGDEFVAISFHSDSQNGSGGAMSYVPEENWPLNPPSFPAAALNREYGIDPYYGFGSGPDFGLETAWNALRDGHIAPCDISCQAALYDDREGSLYATATARFAADVENNYYRLAFALVGDGLTNPSWLQTNYYSGNTSYTGELWEQFTSAGQMVAGLKYNDVALQYDMPIGGITGSLPAQIQMGRNYQYEYIFDISSLPTDASITAERLRVVAMVIDAETNRVVNCCTSPYPGHYTGVEAVEASGTVVATEWYDLQGRRIESPATGLYLRLTRYADGTSRCDKVAR